VIAAYAIVLGTLVLYGTRLARARAVLRKSPPMERKEEPR
jgi:hypothetical protein